MKSCHELQLNANCVETAVITGLHTTRGLIPPLSSRHWLLDYSLTLLHPEGPYGKMTNTVKLFSLGGKVQSTANVMLVIFSAIVYAFK